MGFLLKQVLPIFRRSQKRITLSLPLEVCGKDESGHFFSTKAFLRNASPDGGCIVIDKDLNLGQFFKISGPKGTTFPARVCWENYYFKNDQRILGFKLEGNRAYWVLANGAKRNSKSLYV
jgi:hypothetical protein